MNQDQRPDTSLPAGEGAPPRDTAPRLHWKDVVIIVMVLALVAAGYVYFKPDGEAGSAAVVPTVVPTAVATAVATAEPLPAKVDPTRLPAVLVAATNPSSAAAPGEKFYIELRGARLAPCEVKQRDPATWPNICLYAEEGTYKALGTPAAGQETLKPGLP